MCCVVSILALVLLVAPFGKSFAPQLSGLRGGTPSLLSTIKDGDLDGLDRARERFEHLVEPYIQPYAPPPLTSSSQRRRQVEMQLLESLRDSDDAVDELMNLWMVERDAESAQQLVEMEEWCSEGLVEEEEALRGMIDDYGLDWPEPASRLAALLYFKGNSLESMQWAERALQVKPWHFETMHIQVLNCLRVYPEGVYKFARQGLPPLRPSTGNAARGKWVDQALIDAQEALQQAAQAKKHLAPELRDSAWE